MDPYAILAAGMGPAKLLAAYPDEPRAIIAAASAALAADELVAGELLERELRPLAALPGWYAFRPPATVADGYRIDDVLFLRADLVARELGYTPDAPVMLPGTR